MKGAPMYDTSSKHGTNANYSKSGAPGVLGNTTNSLGAIANMFSNIKNIKNNQAVNTNQTVPQETPMQPGGSAPVVNTNVAPVASATATPAVAEEAVPAVPMKKNLKVGSPLPLDIFGIKKRKAKKKALEAISKNEKIEQEKSTGKVNEEDVKTAEANLRKANSGNVDLNSKESKKTISTRAQDLANTRKANN